MQPFKYISRHFDRLSIVWIEEINQWIRFEQPAFFVFEKLAENMDSNAIIREFSMKFQAEVDEARNFVLEMKKNITELFEKKDVQNDEEKISRREKSENPHSEQENSKVHFYKANDRIIRIDYETELLEYYIHHSFSHLKTISSSEPDFIFRVTANQLIEIFPHEKNWKCSDIPGLKRRMFIEFGNAIYGKNDDSWMSIIHGSVISKGKESILLCSSTGSGKTTLAALMQSHGYRILSDDYVAVDGNNSLFYPFPAAFSVKKGSFDLLSEYYPELKKQPERIFHLTNKSLRFIPPRDFRKFEYTPRPLQKVIFVKYDPDRNVDFTELTAPDAFPLFSDEAWISPDPVYASRFLNWFSALKFYRLIYGNTQKTIEWILNLPS